MTEFEWLDIFSDNLADMLSSSGMSQRELAEEAGLSEATISSSINKRKIPSLRAIINISYVLDCDIGELIDFGGTIE